MRRVPRALLTGWGWVFGAYLGAMTAYALLVTVEGLRNKMWHRQ